MSSTGAQDYSAAVWDIATPSRPGRLPGLAMAAFRARTSRPYRLGVVPYPAVTLLVNLGDDPITVDGAVGPQRGHGLVLGMAGEGVRGSGSRIECLQLRLSPVLAHAVLGGPSAAGAAVASLDDLWGGAAERLRERLRAAGSWPERFSVAEAALLRRYETGRAVDPEIGLVWRRILESRGGARVERLADEAGWSRKRLWSRFRWQIGLSPKRAAQLVRFDHAAHRLAEGSSAALVAAELGYADQSHLHREAAAFAGLTPTALAGAPWLAVDGVAWADPAYR